ncbi:hypothetical protein ABRY23_05975 [Melioribacteraceae bacterium 4301-Me]|uniref:hypothetical protein n=1 Tax=Pyranulibacter aquaticus TaxID=3163344 RepID=UPI00359ADEC5
MIHRLKSRYVLLVVLLVLFFLIILSLDALKNTDEELYFKRFVNLKNKICFFCNEFKILPRLYVATIYAELHNNYNIIDRFDEFRAKIGMDPSVGFAQMRVSTAIWIEDYYSDNKIIFKSNSYEELVNKIIDDSTNIVYSTFYIKLIHDRLLKKFHKKPSVKTIASYYGRGIDYYRGDEIDSLYYNQIGITAEEFFYSDMLIEQFPR